MEYGGKLFFRSIVCTVWNFSMRKRDDFMKKYKNTIIRSLYYSLIVAFLISINTFLYLENIITKDINDIWLLLLTFALSSYLYMVFRWKVKVVWLWMVIIVVTQVVLCLVIYHLFYIFYNGFWKMIGVCSLEMIIGGYTVVLIAFDIIGTIIHRIYVLLK